MRILGMLGIAAACLASSAAADAASFVFTQDGYPDSATITGSFQGSDLNHDGFIDSFDGELTSFVLSYSGSSDVDAFTFTQADFNTAPHSTPGGLVYALGGNFNGPNEGIQVGNGFNNTFVALGGADQDTDFCAGKPGCGFVGGDESGAIIQVTPVPEIATWAMFVGGFGLVGAAMRRRSVRFAFA